MALWPAVASLVSAAGTLFLVAYLRRYRGKPGADWFLASLVSQTALSVAYGVALFVFDPLLRWALEVFAWTATTATAAYFLAFATAYTGRDRLLEPYHAVVAVSPVVVGAVVATNPVHGLVWTDFAIDPVLGLATVSYALRPWTLVFAAAGVVVTALGSLLLFETVVSYGPLYRRAAVAVGLSTIPPVVALLVWLAGVGPVPQLNFVTVAFLPHVALDAYAFVGNDMFDFHPATRRAGERAAIDDLGAPVVVVDEHQRVVTLNDAAETAFGVDKRGALTRPLADLVGTDLDLTDGSLRATVRRDVTRSIYSVTPTPLTDATGTHLGHTVVFQDVTAEHRREQRLGVLNRVLRHNLRNDMTVVRGFVQAAAERVDDDDTVAMLDRATGKVDELVALGEKARDVERVLDREVAVERVALADLLADVAGDADADPDATVTVDADVSVTTDPVVLRVVVATLLENALVHAGPAPTVEVGARRRNGTVEVTVADDGPGLPDHEREVVEGGGESALEHGSGLGLWLATWGATTLGGDLSFTVDDGTTAVVSLPDR